MQNSKTSKKSKTNSNFYKIKVKKKNSMIHQDISNLKEKNLSD